MVGGQLRRRVGRLFALGEEDRGRRALGQPGEPVDRTRGRDRPPLPPGRRGPRLGREHLSATVRIEPADVPHGPAGRIGVGPDGGRSAVLGVGGRPHRQGLGRDRDRRGRSRGGGRSGRGRSVGSRAGRVRLHAVAGRQVRAGLLQRQPVAVHGVVDHRSAAPPAAETPIRAGPCIDAEAPGAIGMVRVWTRYVLAPAVAAGA